MSSRIIASCENMPSGGAVKPADIVTSMSGQTVEILNTDAEGRLVLCDAITYSRRFKPAAVVDVATLTGACIIALGNQISGLMSNDEALAARARRGRQPRRRPRLAPAHRRRICRTTEEQLRGFRQCRRARRRRLHRGLVPVEVRQGSAWAHLDVAGTAWLGGSQKGSTGRPVPLLVDFLFIAPGT